MFLVEFFSAEKCMNKHVANKLSWTNISSAQPAGEPGEFGVLHCYFIRAVILRTV